MPISELDRDETALPQRSARFRRCWPALAFGLGAGLGLGLVVAAAYWYVNRPRPWNATAVSAVPVRTYATDNSSVAFQYKLRNNTNRDLRMSLRGPGPSGALDWRVFERNFRGLVRLSSFGVGTAGVEPSDLFLPPGEEIALTLEVFALLSPKDPPEEVQAWFRRQRFAGFVIFDPENRIRVDLPFSEATVGK